MATQGERIKIIREHLRLSQEEFGKILNVSKQWIFNVYIITRLVKNIRFYIQKFTKPTLI